MAMSARLMDLQDSIDANPNNPSAERLWRVTGIENPGDNLDDVIAFVVQESDDWLLFRVPNSVAVEGAPIFPETVATRIYRKAVKVAYDGPNAALCVVTYGVQDAVPHPSIGGTNPAKNEDDGGQGSDEQYGPEFSSDTTEGTSHILQLDETVEESGFQRMRRKECLKYNYTTNTQAAADLLNGLIGLSDDRVEGAKIRSGGNVFTVTQKGVPWTPEYEMFLEDMEFTVNQFAAFNRETEEVLYLGSKKNYKAGDGWVFVHSFERGRTKQNVKIGGFVIPEIKPFDHIHVAYEKTIADGQLAKRPIRITIDRLYPLRDHTLIFEFGA